MSNLHPIFEKIMEDFIYPVKSQKVKIIVAFSGGKDSHASLIWALNESGYKKENIEAVFCDTNWEDYVTYDTINRVIKDNNINFKVLKSKKYTGFEDMCIKRKRVPSTRARFCTEELKTIPMINYILDECQCNIIVIQGIRKDESNARSLMTKQCSYFRYYFEPYGFDKKGKPKYHTYRKDEVIEFRKKYLDDVIRPVFDWSATEVLNYILEHGQTPNELYYEGVSRVGCFPCIMCRLSEIKIIMDYRPERIQKVIELEEKLGRTFFGPGKIPQRYMTKVDEKTGKKVPTMKDIVHYLKDKDIKTIELFEDEKTDRRCMSFYGICE